MRLLSLLFVFAGLGHSCHLQSQNPSDLHISIERADVDGINESYSLAEFDSLLQAHGGTLTNLDIRIVGANREDLYEQSETNGLTTVQRTSYGHYRLNEYWILSLADGNFFGQVHLFTFDADLNTGSIAPDKNAVPAIHIWEQSFPEVIAAFDSLEQYERAHPTNEDWDNVSPQQWFDTEAVACKLALSALNGCEPCLERFKKVRKTFDYMNAGETSEILWTYERMVMRYEQIQGKMPGKKTWAQLGRGY